MANTLDNLFNEGLAFERENAGYSQAEVTKHMQSIGFDWNNMTLSRIERGQRKVTAGEAIALAQFFNVEVREMAGVTSRYWSEAPIALEEFSEVILEVLRTMVQFRDLDMSLEELFRVVSAYDKNSPKSDKLKMFGDYQNASSLLKTPIEPLHAWAHSSGNALRETMIKVYTSKEFLDYINNVDIRSGILASIPDFIQEMYAIDENDKYYIPEDAA